MAHKILDFILLVAYGWFFISSAVSISSKEEMQALNLLLAVVILAFQMITVTAQANGQKRKRFLYMLPIMSYWLHQAVFYFFLLFIDSDPQIHINTWSLLLRQHLGIATVIKERFVNWRDTNGLGY